MRAGQGSDPPSLQVKVTSVGPAEEQTRWGARATRPLPGTPRLKGCHWASPGELGPSKGDEQGCRGPHDSGVSPQGCMCTPWGGAIGVGAQRGSGG